MILRLSCFLTMMVAFSNMVPAYGSEGNFRFFCESLRDELPYVNFSFYPEGQSSTTGRAVLVIDHGKVLDALRYSHVEIDLDDEGYIRAFYTDGTVNIKLSEEGDHFGTIKHLMSLGVLRSDLTCTFANYSFSSPL